MRIHKFSKLFEVVSAYMIHGPCGITRNHSPYMKNVYVQNTFWKSIPKLLFIDDDDFAIYRRRDTGVHIIQKEVELDNRFVIPYNFMLLMKYRTHIINIEYYNKSISINYSFKYI